MQQQHDLPLLVEDVPWAKPLIQTLRGRTNRVIPFAPGGHSKEARAGAVAPYVEGGNWYLPQGRSWTGEFIEEHASLPNGAHDDQVDTTSMLGLRLFQTGTPLPSSMPTLRSYRSGVTPVRIGHRI